MGCSKKIYYSYSNYGLTIEPHIDIVSELTVGLKNKLRRRVLKQIKKQGFTVDKNQIIKKPDMESKDFIRKFHESACESRYEKNIQFLTKNENKLLTYFANGDEIDIRSFKARLQIVEPNTIGNDLFRYSTLLWSVPVSSGYGRRVRFLLWDQSNDKLVGIFALGDPVFNIKCRDDWIGWNSKMRMERLYNVMDVFVLGAVPPYNMLLGGKLVAMVAASNEVRSIIQKRYENRETIHDKQIKDSNLALLTTSSALGKSSLYDRIKFSKKSSPSLYKRLEFNKGVLYKRIGQSVGWGHFHFNHGLFEDLRKYYELFDPIKASANRYGDGPNWKLRTARLCLKQIGLPEDLLKHGINREIYGIPLAYNFKEYLKGETNKLENIDMSFDELTEYWKSRWSINRAKNKPEYQEYNKENVLNIIHNFDNNGSKSNHK